MQERSGGQNIRIETAIASGRGNNGDARHAGHLGRNDVHQQARNKWGLAAASTRHVATGRVHRSDDLAEHGAVGGGDPPGLFFLGFMEGPDIGGGLGDDRQIVGRNGIAASRDCRFGNTQTTGLKAMAVKPLGQLHKRGVATFGHILKNVLDFFDNIAGSFFTTREQSPQRSEIRRTRDGKTRAGHAIILGKGFHKQL